MPISLETVVAFDSPEMKRFLADPTQQERKLDPTMPPDFLHDPTDRRPSLDPVTGAASDHMEAVGFLMRETYRVIAQGIPSGTQYAVVAYETDVNITVEFWLGFKIGLEQRQIDHGRSLLRSYDPLQHGPDLSHWIEANLNGELSLDDFELTAAVVLTKVGLPREVDTRQRDALFGLFGGQESRDVWSTVDIVDGDLLYRDWATDRQAQLQLTASTVVIDDAGPVQDPSNCVEVQVARDPAVIGPIIDAVLAPIWDQGCGAMRVEQFKLLTVGGWPEFKVIWVARHIKVGCCRITIMMPVLQTRTCLLVFYVYYSLPRDIGRTVLKIAETCAIRSALTSAVIGAITSNIAAAVASFTPLFKRCLESEILKCVDPGIMLLKERDGWH